MCPSGVAIPTVGIKNLLYPFVECRSWRFDVQTRQATKSGKLSCMLLASSIDLYSLARGPTSPVSCLSEPIPWKTSVGTSFIQPSRRSVGLCDRTIDVCIIHADISVTVLHLDFSLFFDGFFIFPFLVIVVVVVLPFLGRRT